jgi:hypothetical protein
MDWMDVARNKMMLGALTMGDIHELVKRRLNYAERYREFSIGRNWLPISRVQRRGGAIMLWMEDIGELSDVVIPSDSVVKVHGEVVSVVLDSDNVHHLHTSRNRLEVRIRLDFEPFPEKTLA